MSQHWYEVKSNQGIVQVMLGWVILPSNSGHAAK